MVTISSGLDNPGLAEAVRSLSDAHGLLRAFDAAATGFGVRNEQRLKRLAAAEIPAHFAACARLKDLCSSRSVAWYSIGKIAERLIFESGRLILMCLEEFAAELAVAFDDVAIAWNHTAPAARAVADALPMLQSAASVRIITATDDNTPAEPVSTAALANHLEEHGVRASFETVKIDGSSVGKIFERYVAANAIDLRVMGAFRHSRLNQIIWGGATKIVIGRLPCWIMPFDAALVSGGW